MFDSYYVLNQKIKKHILMFPLFITFIFIFSLLLLYKIKVPFYLEGTATVDYDTNILLNILIPLNKLKLIKNRSQIIINEKKYNYQIEKIKENKLQENVTVYISVDLNEEIHNKNDKVEYKIEIKQMNLIDYLRKN